MYFSPLRLFIYLFSPEHCIITIGELIVKIATRKINICSMVYTFTSSHLVPILTIPNRKGRKGTSLCRWRSCFPAAADFMSIMQGQITVDLPFDSKSRSLSGGACMIAFYTSGSPTWPGLESSGNYNRCAGSTQDSDFMVWGVAWS